MPFKPTSRPAKHVGFYAQLPRSIIAEIKRRAKARQQPQWLVVATAIRATSPFVFTKK